MSLLPALMTEKLNNNVLLDAEHTDISALCSIGSQIEIANGVQVVVGERV